ncbi:hypothetical protein ASG43_03360 [Aureimonas sp. Leaf454]|uniref:hypothetical protein n=1 Tax=Aureimonas sp. Leaf454 TaxID=1736381 RepID=UPI0006F2FC93|nr:hypothetical protein [Aureimonas sp. Leaf454]KQT54638.1 hypothetical protein ASG43_03360 [Aureimonas sp. Leaf454]
MNEELDTAADDQIETEETAADVWAEFEEADGGAPAGDAGTNADADAGDEEGEGADFGDDDDAVAANGGGADAGDTAPSVWDSAPEALRNQFEALQAENAKLLQKERSASGRASGFQRRYEDLKKAAEPRATPGDRPAPQAALDALKEDYPEIAEPLSQALNAIQGDVATLAEAEEGRRKAAETELTDYLDTEAAALTSQHPDYLDVLKTNSDKFVAWIDDQPRAVRDAFNRNAEHVVNAAEAAAVVGMFKEHLGMPAPAPAAERPAATPSLASRRERQLGATAAPTRAHRRPTVSGIPENADPQDIWDAFEDAERR